ncbi:YbhB/YbcL family Raf kinase inhibitor-like protein [Candidatus Nitrosacidococcus tergens]|uniref:Phosphatidylethanolamine-binding protein n=1 Tax=Candidatus Nitrosacidococcus tergens TaxID=553981 RepID=A0A7G1QAK7_9GAMM|nr:YbhB/YbcL family Raf kinase inhibitor-like protein [Candidatus Nitrosacidococcus tergens]CAB1276093.1 conserved exported protein of unknown function [Candidatus Nitrosacidococcus tergens]
MNNRFEQYLFVFLLGISMSSFAADNFTFTSPAFDHQAAIPEKYTCEGQDISPELTWNHLPEGTKSLALIMYDPDAPDPKAPMFTWVHWVLYNIPPSANGLTEGIKLKDLPKGTLAGSNNWGWSRPTYGGPCPPIGRHRYFFKLYALDTILPDLKALTKDKLEQAIQNHIIEEKELIGTYQKHG